VARGLGESHSWRLLIEMKLLHPKFQKIKKQITPLFFSDIFQNLVRKDCYIRERNFTYQNNVNKLNWLGNCVSLLEKF